jgi:hypothetical protein
MNSKTKILHYIALNPGKTFKEIAIGTGIKQGTVRVYITDLNKEKMVSSLKNHRWGLSAAIPIESLDIPPEEIHAKKAWEIAHENIMNMMRLSHVSQ